MIKINLLPREERKRHAPINTKLLLAGVGCVVALLAMGYGWFWLNGEVNRLRSTVLANEKRQAAANATNAKAVASLASAQAAATGVAKDNGDTTVYITRTGAKYHRAGCSSLSRSSIPIKLRDAVARGYGPCSRCRPPTLTAR